MRADAGRAFRGAALRAVLIALLILLAVPALAEETLLEKWGLDDLARESEALGGVDVRTLAEQLLTGELPFNEATVRHLLRRFVEGLRRSLTEALRLLAAPALACLAMRALLPDGEGGALRLVCRLSCAAALMGRFSALRVVAENALRASSRIIDTAAPVLATALNFTGTAGRAAILTPSAAICARLLTSVLGGAGLSLCSAAAAVAAGANLSDQFRLDRLFDVMRRFTAWLIGVTLAGFVGLLALQGLLASGQDALTARALRRAIQTALPVVGGEVSDSAGVLLGSAIAARNAVGVAGMLAAAGVCVAPVARLSLASLSLRLAAAAMEPVCDPGIVRVTGSFAAMAQLLASICAGGVLMSVLCLGGCLALAG